MYQNNASGAPFEISLPSKSSRSAVSMLGGDSPYKLTTASHGCMNAQKSDRESTKTRLKKIRPWLRYQSGSKSYTPNQFTEIPLRLDLSVCGPLTFFSTSGSTRSPLCNSNIFIHVIESIDSLSTSSLSWPRYPAVSQMETNAAALTSKVARSNRPHPLWRMQCFY